MLPDPSAAPRGLGHPGVNHMLRNVADLVTTIQWDKYEDSIPEVAKTQAA